MNYIAEALESPTALSMEIRQTRDRGIHLATVDLERLQSMIDDLRTECSLILTAIPFHGRKNLIAGSQPNSEKLLRKTIDEASAHDQKLRKKFGEVLGTLKVGRIWNRLRHDC